MEFKNGFESSKIVKMLVGSWCKSNTAAINGLIFGAYVQQQLESFDNAGVWVRMYPVHMLIARQRVVSRLNLTGHAAVSM